MKKLYPITLIFVLAFLSFSCGKSENTTPIIGKWVEVISKDFDTTKTVKEISFSSSQGQNDFVAYGWYKNNIRGAWTLEEKKLELTFVEPIQHSIDSISVQNLENGGSSFEFYEDNQLSALGESGKFKANLSTKSIQINRLNNQELAFTFNREKHIYTRFIKEARSISMWSILRGAFGIMALILITYLFSGKRKKIDWMLVMKGTALQVIIAILVLKVPFIEGGFHKVSQVFVTLISYTDAGVDFLFGQFGIGKVQPPLITFAVKVLPTIIFFSALMSALYYIGVLQKIVYAFAWIMKKFMRLSGAESLAAAGNIFLGQTESPLLVKPYLMGMTKSEMMCLMTGGMATIAGGVLAAYVSFLGGDDPVQQAFFAKHLLTASIISAPAAIVAAKILVPETEKINEDLKIDKQKIGTNLLEAISNGTSDGLKLAVNVGAMLIVFTALMAMGNGILDAIGEYSGLNSSIASSTPYNGLSFQFLLGYIGAPIVWLIGVDGGDMVAVGELLGQKTVLNEFIAYPRLGQMKEAGMLSEKSIIISTYMLCGFANFASIGIQIGGIGSLAPTRKGLLSKLGMKALLGGTIASLMTAAIVGMLY